MPPLDVRLDGGGGSPKGTSCPAASHTVAPLAGLTRCDCAEWTARVLEALGRGWIAMGSHHNPPGGVMGSWSGDVYKCSRMGTEEFLEHLKSLPWYRGQVEHCQHIPARTARYAVPDVPLHPAVLCALRDRGVTNLFTHQAQAIELLHQGRHTVVATSTASGKSLCYNLPILHALAEDSNACALYLFPTKALAQDQLRALRELLAQAFGGSAPSVEIYDGDTPMGERGGIRERAQLLITNPDMLHLSVLPVHPQFRRLLANLRYVVVDEGHTYKGVFGCHTALVLRRLRRLCEQVYRSRPTFVVTTATVANPREHSLSLLGVNDVEVILEDGSPHGPKCFVLWNPPLLLPGKGGTGGDEGDEGGRPKRGRRSKALGKRAMEEGVRSLVREAHQERGRGSHLGPLGEGDWVAAVKLGRRRAAVEAAARQALSGSQHAQHAGGSSQEHSVQQQAGVTAAGLQQERSMESTAQQRCGAGEAQAGETEGTAALAQRAQQGERGAEVKPEGGKEGTPGPPSASSPSLLLPAETAPPPRPLILRGGGGLREVLGSGGPSGRQRAQHSRLSQRGGGGQGRKGGGGAPVPMSPTPSCLEGSSCGETGKKRGVEGPVGTGGGAAVSVGGDERGEAKGGEASEGAVHAPGAVQSRLPTRAAWKARSGAAGTPQDQRRSSPIVEISMLLAECVQHGLRTIAFCHTRKLCELVAAYVREILRVSAPTLEGSISVYRGGYSPSERREIEGALFHGRLRAVAATNALELGIDVGALDVTLHLGFPGSVASLWQQAGRAGRREQASMSLYVAWDGPLDQYFMLHPDRLFGRPVEKAQLDPRNPAVLEAHVACAAAEAPLHPQGDAAYFGESLEEIVRGLQGRRILGRHPRQIPSPDPTPLHYVGAAPSPASKISLRAIDPERFAIVNEAGGGDVIEEIEESKAFYQVYDGAVYMFQGRTYLCKKLDLASRVAVVRPADVKYYTKTIDYTDVHVTGGQVAFPPKEGGAGGSGGSARCGEALVTVRWLGFNRVWRGSGHVFDTVDLFLPDVQYQTEATYIRLPPTARLRLRDEGLGFRDGVHAAAHALLNVLPLHLMSNPQDVGTECDNPYDTRYRPERLLIYDKHPGGIGLAAAACPMYLTLLEKALELVEGCDCSGDVGCPSCIQHTHCGEYNTVLSKAGGVLVLRAVLEAEDARAAGEIGMSRRSMGSQAEAGV